MESSSLLGVILYDCFSKKEVFGWNGDAYNLIKNLNNQVVSMFQTRYFWFWKKGKPACLTTLWCQEWNLHVNIASIYLGFRINRYFSCNMFNHGVLYSITSIFVVSECGNTHMPLCHLQSFLCINIYIYIYIYTQILRQKCYKHIPEGQNGTSWIQSWEVKSH